MNKLTKNCLNCDISYTPHPFFYERSKFHSNPCKIEFKKKQRDLKARLLKQEKSQKKAVLAKRLRRKDEVRQVTMANKKTEFVRKEEATFAFGDNLLTLKNYKEPLTRIPKNLGVGWYGTLAATTDGTKIQCHICGALQESLPGHISQTHKLKIRDYKEKFKLAYTTALVSESQRLKLKERTMAWLEKMTTEEKEAYIQKRKEIGKTYHLKRGNYQPKKTLEAMNRDESCPDQTLQKIKDVKKQIGKIPTKKEFMLFMGSQRYIHLAYKHFGSWKKAIEMCRFGKNENWIRTGKGFMRKSYTDEELLEYLRIYAEEYQQIPTISDWKRDLLPRYGLYTKRFGTIENARQEAGVYNNG